VILFLVFYVRAPSVPKGPPSQNGYPNATPSARASAALGDDGRTPSTSFTSFSLWVTKQVKTRSELAEHAAHVFRWLVRLGRGSRCSIPPRISREQFFLYLLHYVLGARKPGLLRSHMGCLVWAALPPRCAPSCFLRLVNVPFGQVPATHP